MVVQVSRLYVYDLPEPTRYVLLRASRWTVFRDHLKDGRVPAMWSRTDRGWCLRKERLADVIAGAENAGWVVDLKGPIQ